jgi:putative DNA primase/helicase
MNTINAAKGYWSQILISLGVNPGYLNGRHSRCPICGQGKDTFRFDDKNGSGSYFCGKCGAGYGINFVMKLFDLSFADAAKRVDETIGNKPLQVKSKINTRNPRILLRSIAKGLQPGLETDAENYLRSRGIEVFSDELRFHPGLNYWGRDNQGKPVKRGEFSAMVAPVCSPDGRPLTYHITYLSNGRKANVESPKKVMTPTAPIAGGAIRLFPPADHLGIAEGIETALAVNQKYSIPVWATISANGMLNIAMPDLVKKVSVFADNDTNFVGQKSAFSLASRLCLMGIETEVFIPQQAGKDFLDEISSGQILNPIRNL